MIHMIFGFSCKLNFEGEKKITMHYTTDCKSSNIFLIKCMLSHFNELPSHVAKPFQHA